MVLEADLVRDIEELRNGGQQKVQTRNVRWQALPKHATVNVRLKDSCERLAGATQMMNWQLG